MTSPVTTEWLALPADIRSAAETAVGHLRWPLTHADVLLRVGRAIKAERERCALLASDVSFKWVEDGNLDLQKALGEVLNEIIRGDA